MERTWWKEAVIYRIYPRSFFDSNGDGIGDLQGITQKLDYLRRLGVDLLWLCPIFESPCYDDGNDVSDHQRILSEYGTMDDFYELLKGAHALGLRVMLDLPVTSTSDKHPWFRVSSASRRSSKRDFYFWKSPNWGDPPNNWTCAYGDSAWRYDPSTEQSFLHFFSKHQPELNWENYKLRQEIYAIMKWWLDMGVDGLHIPQVHSLSKPDGLPDSPKPESDIPPTLDRELLFHRPATHQYLREMRRKLFHRYNMVSMGGGQWADVEQAARYSGEEREELDIVVPTAHLQVDCGAGGRYDPVSLELYQFKHVLSEWQTGLERAGWQALFLGNENEPRMVSRFGDDSPEYRERSAKMLATLLLTLKGTPFLYQGDEIGMTNCIFSEIGECRALESRVFYESFMQEEDAKPSRAMNLISTRGSDSAHTPMQWGMGRSSGFTKDDPWIKVNPNHVRLNVSLCESDDYSILNYYRKAIALRKAQKTLVYGRYVPLDDMNGQHYCYLRTDEDGTYLILLNFTRGRIFCTLPLVLRGKAVEQLLGNYEKEDASNDSERIQQYVSDLFNPNQKHEDKRFFNLSDEIRLRPYEAMVLKIL